MKKLVKLLLTICLFTLLVNGCDDTDDFDDQFCGEYEGKQLYKKPDGRCYYIDNDGKIVTVESSNCDC